MLERLDGEPTVRPYGVVHARQPESGLTACGKYAVGWRIFWEITSCPRTAGMCSLYRSNCESPRSAEFLTLPGRSNCVRASGTAGITDHELRSLIRRCPDARNAPSGRYGRPQAISGVQAWGSWDQWKWALLTLGLTSVMTVLLLIYT